MSKTFSPITIQTISDNQTKSCSQQQICQNPSTLNPCPNNDWSWKVTNTNACPIGDQSWVDCTGVCQDTSSCNDNNGLGNGTCPCLGGSPAISDDWKINVNSTQPLVSQAPVGCSYDSDQLSSTQAITDYQLVFLDPSLSSEILNVNRAIFDEIINNQPSGGNRDGVTIDRYRSLIIGLIIIIILIIILVLFYSYRRSKYNYNY